jgi:hypothetical protein
MAGYYCYQFRVSSPRKTIDSWLVMMDRVSSVVSLVSNYDFAVRIPGIWVKWASGCLFVCLCACLLVTNVEHTNSLILSSIVVIFWVG